MWAIETRVYGNTQIQEVDAVAAEVRDDFFNCTHYVEHNIFIKPWCFCQGSHKLWKSLKTWKITMEKSWNLKKPD